MEDLISSKIYNRVIELRERIKQRTEELGITTDHDETGHFYVYQGKRYPSVTGRLQILKDPGLMNWKMNRALEYVLNNYHIGANSIHDVIAQAKLAPVQEFEGAGDIGRIVHDWREKWFRHLINGGTGGNFTWPEQDTRVTSACRAIQKFVHDTNYIPIACELYVASHELQTGGTLDDIGLINGKLALVDLKTSNIGNKDSYYAQVLLYYHMFFRLYGIKPRYIYILHVSKTDGTYDLIPLHEQINIPKTIAWAKKVVQVSQGLDELREAKKVKPIVI